jgi:hypothetical protein
VSNFLKGQPISLKELPFGFGVEIAAADPAKARAFSSALSKVISAAAAQNSTLKVSQDKIGDADVTVLHQDLPMSPQNPLALDIVIGADDHVFFCGTRAMAEEIFGGKPGLNGIANYADASKYMLPNANAVFYMGQEGFAAFAATVFANSFPVSLVVSNAANALVSGKPPIPAPVELQQQVEARIALLNSLVSMIDSATISSVSTDQGDSILRVVVTLAQ